MCSHESAKISFYINKYKSIQNPNCKLSVPWAVFREYSKLEQEGKPNEFKGKSVSDKWGFLSHIFLSWITFYPNESTPS